MNTKIILALAAAVIVIGGASVAIFGSRPDELPFRGCGEECHPSQFFDFVSLSPLTGEYDVLAVRVKPDGTVVLGETEERRAFLINVFADYNGNGKYDADSPDERVAADVLVDPSVETDHVFLLPSAQEYGMHKKKFAVTVTASLLPLAEAVAESTEKNEEPNISMSHFLFDTDERVPVGGIFEAIDRELARESVQGGPQTVEIPSTCIDATGSQVPCAGEETPASETPPATPEYHLGEFGTPERFGDQSVFGDIPAPPTAHEILEEATIMELRESYGSLPSSQELIDEYLERLKKIDEQNPVPPLPPLEAAEDDTGSVLDYLTEANVIA